MEKKYSSPTQSEELNRLEEASLQETDKPFNKPRKGKKLSEEHKAKISKAKKGRKLSAETKAKISDSLKGRTSWNKGKKFSEETKAKMAMARNNSEKVLNSKRLMKEAIKLHVEGMSMRKASLAVGFGEGWLVSKKHLHSEQFAIFYKEVLDEINIDQDDNDRIKEINVKEKSSKQKEKFSTISSSKKDKINETLNKIWLQLEEIEKQILARYYGLGSYKPQTIEEINAELLQGSSWGEQKIKNLVKEIEINNFYIFKNLLTREGS